MQFEWDPAKAAANLTRHGVSFHEAAAILADPLSTTFPDEVHSEDEARFLTIGASKQGNAKRYYPHHQRPSSDEVGARIL